MKKVLVLTVVALLALSGVAFAAGFGHGSSGGGCGNIGFSEIALLALPTLLLFKHK